MKSTLRRLRPEEGRQPPNAAPRPAAAAGSALHAAQTKFDGALCRFSDFLENGRRLEMRDELAGAASVLILMSAAVGSAAALAGGVLDLRGASAAPAVVGAAVSLLHLWTSSVAWSWRFGAARHRLGHWRRDLVDADDDIQTEFDLGRAALARYESRSVEALVAMSDAAMEQIYQHGALDGLKHADAEAVERSRLRTLFRLFWMAPLVMAAAGLLVASLFLGA